MGRQRYRNAGGDVKKKLLMWAIGAAVPVVMKKVRERREPRRV